MYQREINENKREYNQGAIHDFAIKWIEEFKTNERYYTIFDNIKFADECSSLGFKMDCGNSFKDKYGDAVYSDIELSKVIDDVDDIALLGSAIFSRWRYFNHWSYGPAEQKDKEWFIIALSRLDNLVK